MQAENVKRLTGPVAVVVMVWVVLGMLHQLGLFLLVDGLGPYPNAGWSPFGAVEAVVLSLVVSVSVLWARPRQAAALVLGAVVVAAVGVLLQIGSLVVSAVNLFNGLSEPDFALLEVFRLVLNLVLPVLALAWLITLRRGRPEVTEPPALPQRTGPAPAWQPEQAAGAHWQTASGAATGSAANIWGTPGERGGWGPPTHALEAGPAGPRTPSRPDGPAHQPRGPEQFGPQAQAEQYARPAPEEADQTRIGPSERRPPPNWTPLDRDRR